VSATQDAMTGKRVRRLHEDQLEQFHGDCVYPARFSKICKLIDQDFPGGKFSFLDIGGGSGVFTNRVLERYPLSRGTLLDNSELMHDINIAHPRKALVMGSAEELHTVLGEQRFDIIFLNFLLHHLVMNSYADTRTMQRKVLSSVALSVGANGKISIMEHMCNGAVFENSPSLLIYHMTSSRWVSPIMRRLGANSAGVGVCFLDERQWFREFERVGLRVLAFDKDDNERHSRFRRSLLTMSSFRSGHFWLAPLARSAF
jgi:hypothetical protein